MLKPELERTSVTGKKIKTNTVHDTLFHDTLDQRLQDLLDHSGGLRQHFNAT